jgi:hypothetical protein
MYLVLRKKEGTTFTLLLELIKMVFLDIMQGDFNTVRRYSDFDHLRSTLFARWPGCYIPSLPEKKFIGNEDSVFIEMRKNGLY